MERSLTVTRKPRVLIVEDADLLLEVTIAAFGDAGYETVSASDGEQALALLNGPTPIDLLLTDIRLPGSIDGWDIAERAREARPSLPVIYVTGYDNKAPRPVENSLLFLKPCSSMKLLDGARSLGVGNGWEGLS